MAQTIPPTITASPTQPVRGNRATFSNLVDAFVTWLIAAVAQFGAVAVNCYNNAVDAYNSAVAAAAAAVTATAQAAAAVSVANAVLWVSGTAYAKGASVYSPINVRTYRRLVAGAGIVDPSLDPTNWTDIGQGPRTTVVLSSTQPWSPPSWVTQAEVTVQDGGDSGGTTTASGQFSAAGLGGKASVTQISVSSAVTYMATIGGGATGPAAGTSLGSATGGASSFSGAGMTTLLSTNGTLNIPGGPPVTLSVTGGSPILGGGASFLSPGAGYQSSATGPGGGGSAVLTGNAGTNGKAGVIIIRY